MRPRETTLRFHPDAERDLDAALFWYLTRDPQVASAFLEHLERALAEICAFPNRWPHHRSGCRRRVLQRFPYSIIYRYRAAAVEIVAIAHAKRKPHYWAVRLDR